MKRPNSVSSYFSHFNFQGVSNKEKELFDWNLEGTENATEKMPYLF